MIPVPVLTPYLSSLWLGLVTPLYARVGRKLVESLKNPTVVSSNLADTAFSVRPRSLSRSDRPRTGQRRPRVRRDALVRRPFLCRASRATGAASASDHAWSIHERLRSTLPPARGLRTDSTHWRPDRLVLRELAVAGARLSGSAGRRSGSSAGPSRSGQHPGGRSRSTSGASKASSRIACCGCRPR